MPLNWNPLFVNASIKMWTLNRKEIAVCTLKVLIFYCPQQFSFSSLFLRWTKNKKRKKEIPSNMAVWNCSQEGEKMFERPPFVWLLLFFLSLTFIEFNYSHKGILKVQNQTSHLPAWICCNWIHTSQWQCTYAWLGNSIHSMKSSKLIYALYILWILLHTLTHTHAITIYCTIFLLI